MTGTERRRGACRGADAPPLSPRDDSGLLEVFRRRYLLRLLVRSTVQARYQGTVLGWFWSYPQPPCGSCMYYFVFQVLIGRGSGPRELRDPPVAAAWCVVHFFTETFNGGTRSLVSNRGLIVKLPMPRELFPVATHAGLVLAHVPMLVITIFAQRPARLDARPDGDARGACWAWR